MSVSHSFFASQVNQAYVESLYEDYKSDPASVSKEWKQFFDNQEASLGAFEQIAEGATKTIPLASQPGATSDSLLLCVNIIDNFRRYGHLIADVDPLHLREKPVILELQPEFYGITDIHAKIGADLSSLINHNPASFEELFSYLRKLFCSKLSVQISHINDREKRKWIEEQMEGFVQKQKTYFSQQEKKQILQNLIAGEELDKYLAIRYPGVKRFGLEGAETLICMMNHLIKQLGDSDSEELLIGMAHRGRLNVLINVLGKLPSDLFSEFEGQNTIVGSGDVKYHLGFSSNAKTKKGQIHIALGYNPSHLEVVYPVILGSVRSRQDRRKDNQLKSVVPLIIHGDAAFCGQGVVMESLQMSKIRAFDVGGSLHIVLNNQIGFTTSYPKDVRSTIYSTDVAKFVEVPIFHVNANDPEACVFVMNLAARYRERYQEDVVIDLVCYRKHGHNEADEPLVTQPYMYSKIRKMRSYSEGYSEKLINDASIAEDLVAEMRSTYKSLLEKGERVSPEIVSDSQSHLFVNWAKYAKGDPLAAVDTCFDREMLQKLAEQLLELPENFVLHRSAQKVLDDREAMFKGEKLLDWGAAENLAYASILQDGYDVRLIGQDSRRGTFAHRHAFFSDQQTGESYSPLVKIAEELGRNFNLYDSFLSEEAVMGFEYGYASSAPECLNVWEAQFGDFCNGAQVIIDQFLTSGEDKWARFNGLTLLLPHGYEGAGPEHSSARIERFLQLCAGNNIFVAIPSTPAQLFHFLRRQVKANYRKPLIVFTPKSLLRHKEVVSNMDELATESVKLIIPENLPQNAHKEIKRLIVCSGKVFYELNKYKSIQGQTDTSIARIEQLYPFPEKDIIKLMRHYPNLESVVWCQEEPLNQGAWYELVQHRMRKIIRANFPDVNLLVSSRPASASPAVGYQRVHSLQQTALVEQSFTQSLEG